MDPAAGPPVALKAKKKAKAKNKTRRNVKKNAKAKVLKPYKHKTRTASGKYILPANQMLRWFKYQEEMRAARAAAAAAAAAEANEANENNGNNENNENNGGIGNLAKKLGSVAINGNRKPKKNNNTMNGWGGEGNL